MLKISFLFYLCVMVVIVGAMMILYAILGAIGALDSLTRLIRDLFADQSFEIHGGRPRQIIPPCGPVPVSRRSSARARSVW